MSEGGSIAASTCDISSSSLRDFLLGELTVLVSGGRAGIPLFNEAG
jgi:hypothetical protein